MRPAPQANLPHRTCRADLPSEPAAHKEIRTLTPEAIGITIGAVVFFSFATLAAALETGLTTLSRARVEALAEEGRPRAEKLLLVMENRSHALAAVLLAAIASRVAGIALIGYFAFDRWGAGGFWIAMAAAVLLVYLVSSLLPKLTALRNPSALPLLFAGQLHLATRVSLFRWMAKLSLFRRQNGSPAPVSVVSEEELLAVAEQAEADASIESEERALIEAILRFGDVKARDVMIPRTDMVTLQRDQLVNDALERVLKTTYSRFPVVGEGTDNVIGVVHARDLMLAVRQEGSLNSSIDDVLREVIFAPDTKPAADLLREMQEKRLHMAVLVDEYGGTSGLVTLEDLIEELVGEITDEFDVEEPLVERLLGGDIRVNGRVPQSQLEQLLGVELPKGDWNTVGGLIFTQVGHLPEEGERLEIGSCRFFVERITGQRIARVRVSQE